ncbi:hypothetical protein CEXT_297411 [Caerostris extrusa]|uniref:Secreted protein n=1 Tax=Caerostris extrusa TaxID=172846 RepID=A0AAV4MFT4_CAEEX|nr:hypothetical protein CEXT_297411 [Caerostris extrusa]
MRTLHLLSVVHLHLAPSITVLLLRQKKVIVYLLPPSPRLAGGERRDFSPEKQQTTDLQLALCRDAFFRSVRPGISKLRPAGQIRPASVINPARDSE